ncbi:hypothetical protein E8E12_010315 [Didymella heteroderae]|uniref:Uncharacterized protein n=1 Tax=Didymella heteroderae TaxID=1769908 RepID=A0A9P4X2I7_9PLEO|nr:hypothetical protein E8E12_010315 [Didymella heteroderae]
MCCISYPYWVRLTHGKIGLKTVEAITRRLLLFVGTEHAHLEYSALQKQCVELRYLELRFKEEREQAMSEPRPLPNQLTYFARNEECLANKVKSNLGLYPGRLPRPLLDTFHAELPIEGKARIVAVQRRKNEVMAA